MTGEGLRPTCEAVREVAPDMALGLLTGEERATVLAHLERCERCQAEVASLAIAADELLLAGPAVAPPAGFASRVVAAVAAEAGRAERTAEGGLPAVLGGVDDRPGVAPAPTGPAADEARTAGREDDVARPLDRHRGPAHRRASGPFRRPGGHRPDHLTRRSRRRWQMRVAAAAAAVLVLVAGLVVAGRQDRGTEPEVAAAEMISARGRVVGTATASGEDGEPARVTIDVPDWESVLDRWGGAPAGSYWLVVSQHDGTRTMRALAPDVDAWSMEVQAPVDAVAGVSMVDEDGRVWCTGTFAPA